MLAKSLLAVVVCCFLGSASAIEIAAGVQGTLSAVDGQVVLTVKNAGTVEVQVDSVSVLMAHKPGAKQSEVISTKGPKQRVAPGQSVGVSLIRVDALVAKMRADGTDVPGDPISLITIETEPSGCTKCESRSKSQWIRPFGVQSSVKVGDVSASSLFGGYVTFVRYQ